MSDEVRRYPKGWLALDNGDLMQVTDFKITSKRNVKSVDTLRVEQAGLAVGPKSDEVSFNAVTDEDGPERDYMSMLKQKRIKSLRYKTPGENGTITGVASERTIEANVEDGVKYSVVFVGKIA